MPLLFSLGQHRALEIVNRSHRPGEKLMAFMDDLYCSSEPERIDGCMPGSKKHYRPVQASAFMAARPKCGMHQGSDNQCATFWSRLPGHPTPGPESAEA